MSDDADRAAEIQQAAIDEAIAAHKRRAAVEGRWYCADCGELIPRDRRVLRVERCIDCQSDHELRGRVGA